MILMGKAQRPSTLRTESPTSTEDMALTGAAAWTSRFGVLALMTVCSPTVPLLRLVLADYMDFAAIQAHPQQFTAEYLNLLHTILANPAVAQAIFPGVLACSVVTLIYLGLSIRLSNTAPRWVATLLRSLKMSRPATSP
jgi:hypothetical protein